MKLAFIYNDYFETAGGGERSALELGAALEELGFQLRFVSINKSSKTILDLCKTFDIPVKNKWELETFKNLDILSKEISKFPEAIFFNHTFCSRFNSPLKNSFYCLMFPIDFTPEERVALSSYKIFLCNSRFTEIYLKRRWPEAKASLVLPPPISKSHELASEKKTNLLQNKERNILLVGRFNIRGHNKCQLEAIQAFKELHQNPLFADWKMTIIGGLANDPGSLEYIKACEQEAKDLPIKIITDAPFDTLVAEYQKSLCLWQFTGQHLDFGYHPEHCEHLGLVALDSLAYGTIPMVYHRSGIQYELEYGNTGYFFKDSKELINCMSLLEKDFNSGKYRLKIFNSLINKSKNYSSQAFKDKLAIILSDYRN